MRLLKAFAKIVLSVAALWFVFKKIDINDLLQIFSSVNYAWLFIATLLFIISKVASSYRLNFFFKDIKNGLTEGSNLRLYLLGMYYNLFLPGGIGGDGYKIYLLNKKYKTGVKSVFQAVLLDRVNGVLVLFILALLMIPLIPLPLVYKYLAIATGPVIFLMYKWVIGRFFKVFGKSVLKTSVYSLVVQLSQVLSAWFILLAINQTEQQLSYLFLFLVSSVVATLPITIGGIGSREITFLFGAGIMQLNVSQSIALSLLFYVITAVVSLSGIYFSINEKALKIERAEDQKSETGSEFPEVVK